MEVIPRCPGIAEAISQAGSIQSWILPRSWEGGGLSPTAVCPLHNAVRSVFPKCCQWGRLQLPYNTSVNPFSLWFRSLEQTTLCLDAECSLDASQKAPARYLCSGATHLAAAFSVNSKLFLLPSSHEVQNGCHRPAGKAASHRFFLCCLCGWV